MRLRPLRAWSLLAVAALIVVSCGTISSSTDTTVATTSPATTLPTTTGLETVISDLSGSWENERSVLRVNDAGDYVVLGPDAEPDQPLTGGFVAREEGNFIFVSGVAGECPGQTGVYGAVIEDDLLTLTAIDDPCTARVGWFEPVFTLADG